MYEYCVTCLYQQYGKGHDDDITYIRADNPFEAVAKVLQLIESEEVVEPRQYYNITCERRHEEA